MQRLGFLLIALTGIGTGFAAWFFQWPGMPLYSLMLLLPSLYVLDYFSTREGLAKGQEEVNPIFRKYFLTGDLRRDLIIPELVMVGLAVYLARNTVFVAGTYLFLGCYLGLFIHNGMVGASPSRAVK